MDGWVEDGGFMDGWVEDGGLWMDELGRWVYGWMG